MKKSFLTILTFAFLVSQGIAQNVQVDIHENMDFTFDVHVNPYIEMDMEFDFGHHFDFDYDFDFDFDMDIDTQFDMDFASDILPGFFSDFNFNTDYNRKFYSKKGEGDPSIKEDIEIIIDKDGYENDTELVIKNINGNVDVTGYDGDKIIIKGTKELWKKRGRNISDSEAEEYSLETRMYQGKLYVYIDSPNADVEFRKGRMNYRWYWDEDDRHRVSFHFDLEIKVPNKLAIRASTVNSGDVFVEKMENGVRANNVNGSVTVKDVKGYTTANTVNGNIEVWFSESPKEDTDFQTVNGKIEIYSPKDLSAIVTFESLHGELYTDFEQVKRLPNRLNKERDGEGYRYRINKTSPVQIGDGAIEMGFKMVNGSAYIRERKS